MTAASTGINETTAKAERIDYERVVLSPASHAGYYPGGSVMTVKVLYEKTAQKLLGAQIVGFDGVDKRIDVLATAIRAGMKAADLAELDLAYAPPYSSAKDPVNMAGFIIENIATGKVKQFHWNELSALPATAVSLCWIPERRRNMQTVIRTDFTTFRLTICAVAFPKFRKISRFMSCAKADSAAILPAAFFRRTATTVIIFRADTVFTIS